MKMDKSHPCPHCGNEEPLTKDREIKSVIPDDLMHNFGEDLTDLANRISSLSFEEMYGDFASLPKISNLIRKDLGAEKVQSRLVSQNLPLEFLFPHLENATLDPASLKVFFQLAIEYQIILKNASTFQEGMYRWSLLLPDRLQKFGLTLDAWDKISSVGDNDPIIQGELRKIMNMINDPL